MLTLFVRYYTVLWTRSPSPCSISWYKYHHRTLLAYEHELLTRKADSTKEREEEKDNGMTTKEIEQEIECPRCFDIMTLSSEFDSLGYICRYICQECDLLLFMK
jgi:hypothetical protein